MQRGKNSIFFTISLYYKNSPKIDKIRIHKRIKKNGKIETVAGSV
jgi:hypothetical protein